MNLDKKIKLADLLENGIEGMFAMELEQLKIKVARKSLPVRAELLFRHVPIRKHSEIVSWESSYYRGARLKEVDDLRHEIIHGSGLPKITMSDSRAASEFLHEAAYTALRSLAYKFDLPLDVKHFQSVNMPTQY